MPEKNTVPGIVEADPYHHIHVNTFFRAGQADYELKMGSPFVPVVPFPRQDCRLAMRSATAKDIRRLKRARFRAERIFAKNPAIRGLGAEGEEA